MIYLDHNATTTIRPEVISLVTDIMSETGNASATHAAGRRASSHLETAREQLARAVNVRPAQVIFTSCATESINTILRTFRDDRILASATEHAAVLDCGNNWVEHIAVLPDGRIDLNALEDALKREPKTALVNIMYVNNETGVINPVREAAELAHQYGALVHIDAVQALGKIPVDFKECGADYMSFSAHKIGAPQGVGAFVFGAQKPVHPLIKGGKQEKRQRAGTTNIAGIAGFGLAVDLALANMHVYTRLGEWRDMIENRLLQALPDLSVNGRAAPRVGNTISLTCNGIANTVQIMNLDLEHICVSGGSACSSGAAKPSHVLTAMGLDEDRAMSSIRLSMGWPTTLNDVEGFIDSYGKIVQRLRK